MRPKINKTETQKENIDGHPTPDQVDPVPQAEEGVPEKKTRKSRKVRCSIDVNDLIAEFQAKKEKLVERYQKKLLKAMYR